MKKRPVLISLIDWINITLPLSAKNQVYEILGLDEDNFIDLPRGLHGYARQKAYGNIRVLSEGRSPEMGVHVIFSGQGCREYETYHADGWERLLKRVLESGGKFSRLDLAVDEKRYNQEKPYFTMQMIIRKVKRNECKSKFKSARRIETIRIEGGVSSGQTIYFGSPLSDLQVRMYEKDHERSKAGVDLESGLTTWNRLEFQLKDQRANEAVYEILNGVPVGKMVYGLLSNYVDF